MRGSNDVNVIDTNETHRRSEVVGRPLAALLANDGARVFSVDIDSIQVERIVSVRGGRLNLNPTRRNIPKGLAQASPLKIGSTDITSHTHPNFPLKNA